MDYKDLTVGDCVEVHEYSTSSKISGIIGSIDDTSPYHTRIGVIRDDGKGGCGINGEWMCLAGDVCNILAPKLSAGDYILYPSGVFFDEFEALVLSVEDGKTVVSKDMGYKGIVEETIYDTIGVKVICRLNDFIEIGSHAVTGKYVAYEYDGVDNWFIVERSDGQKGSHPLGYYMHPKHVSRITDSTDVKPLIQAPDITRITLTKEILKGERYYRVSSLPILSESIDYPAAGITVNGDDDELSIMGVTAGDVIWRMSTTELFRHDRLIDHIDAFNVIMDAAKECVWSGEETIELSILDE